MATPPTSSINKFEVGDIVKGSNGTDWVVDYDFETSTKYWTLMEETIQPTSSGEIDLKPVKKKKPVPKKKEEIWEDDLTFEMYQEPEKIEAPKKEPEVPQKKPKIKVILKSKQAHACAV